MPKPITVLVSWSKLSALDLSAFGVNVVQHMTGNVNFPAPAIGLDVLNTASINLQNAYNNRKNGPDAKLEYDTAYDYIDSLLHQQADYVDSIAKGNPALILSAGFDITKSEKTFATVPEAPAAVKLKPEAGGVLNLIIDKVQGASSYMYILYTGEVQNVSVSDNQVVLPAGPQYIIIPEGGTRETVNKLTPGSKINVTALAQNSAGKSALSPLVNSFII
jgi:hypothetical protein